MPDIEQDDALTDEAAGGLGWGWTLLFWMSLYAAGFLLAIICLSPRYVATQRLKDKFDRNAHQLSLLQQEVEQLDLVARALQTDPDFVARMIRTELSGERPSSLLVVEDGLDFHPHQPVTAVTTSAIAEPSPVPAWIELLVTDDNLRTRCQWTLITLVAFGFLILNDTFASGRWRGLIGRLWAPLCRRYFPAR
ncbi:hypothetical protein [Planctomicrobium sp. SH664]|uniref:hypothetical protein n=1 Tax=Planctomicrobium sp. SH664 TaxID=3448125 RepID=UPI003F5B9AA9